MVKRDDEENDGDDSGNNTIRTTTITKTMAAATTTAAATAVATQREKTKKKSKLITPLLHPWKTGQRLGRSTICMWMWYRLVHKRYVSGCLCVCQFVCICECHQTMVKRCARFTFEIEQDITATTVKWNIWKSNKCDDRTAVKLYTTVL